MSSLPYIYTNALNERYLNVFFDGFDNRVPRHLKRSRNQLIERINREHRKAYDEPLKIPGHSNIDYISDSAFQYARLPNVTIVKDPEAIKEIELQLSNESVYRKRAANFNTLLRKLLVRSRTVLDFEQFHNMLFTTEKTGYWDADFVATGALIIAEQAHPDDSEAHKSLMDQLGYKQTITSEEAVEFLERPQIKPLIESFKKHILIESLRGK